MAIPFQSVKGELRINHINNPIETDILKIVSRTVDSENRLNAAPVFLTTRMLISFGMRSVSSTLLKCVRAQYLLS